MGDGLFDGDDCSSARGRLGGEGGACPESGIFTWLGGGEIFWDAGGDLQSIGGQSVGDGGEKLAWVVWVEAEMVGASDGRGAGGGLHGSNGLEGLVSAGEEIVGVFSGLGGDGWVGAEGGGAIVARLGGDSAAEDIACVGVGGEEERAAEAEEGHPLPEGLTGGEGFHSRGGDHGLIFWSASPSVKSWMRVSNFTLVVPMKGSLRVMTSPRPNFS